MFVSECLIDDAKRTGWGNNVLLPHCCCPGSSYLPCPPIANKAFVLESCHNLGESKLFVSSKQPHCAHFYSRTRRPRDKELRNRARKLELPQEDTAGRTSYSLPSGLSKFSLFALLPPGVRQTGKSITFSPVAINQGARLQGPNCVSCVVWVGSLRLFIYLLF